MGGYQYDSALDQFMPSDGSSFKVIKRESEIRHKIETLKFEKNEFYGISQIKDDYLGVIKL